MSKNLCAEFERILERQIQERECKLLEYGSGLSTMSIIKKLLKVSKSVQFVSCEHDKKWFFETWGNIVKLLTEDSIDFSKEQKTYLWSLHEKCRYWLMCSWRDKVKFIREYGSNKPMDVWITLTENNINFQYRLFWMIGRDIKGTDPRANVYIQFPKKLNYDLILIDGNARSSILRRIHAARDELPAGAVILLHDAHRNEYQEAMDLFEGGYFIKDDGECVAEWNDREVSLSEIQKKQELWVWKKHR